MNIVSFRLVNVIETEIPENVMFAFSVRFSEFFEIFIYSAVRFGNGLIVIVDDDY